MMALCLLETTWLILCLRSYDNYFHFSHVGGKWLHGSIPPGINCQLNKLSKKGFPPELSSCVELLCLLRQLPGTALKQAGDIHDGVIPEDTDRLRSLLCFQHGVFHYDGLFHQVGRKVPVTVNGCAHYRCVNYRAIWQSAEGEKLHSDLHVKMQSTDLVRFCK